MNKLIESYNNKIITLSDKTEISDNIIFINNNIISYKEDDLSIEGLKFLEEVSELKNILLIGCGDKFIPPSFEIKKYIHNLGFKLEWTTTKSAIHIFNLLQEDQRDFIALFINK